MLRNFFRDAQQFAVWDYDPGVLAATSCAVSAGAFFSACITVFY